MEKKEDETNLDSLVESHEETITWDDIGGCKEAKQHLQRLSLEIINPEINKRWGGKPPKGILLYGPEGTGKTLLAKAFSTSTDAELWKINGSDIGSKYVNQSAANIKTLFERAQQTIEKEGKTIVMFFDEFDSLARRRDTRTGDGGQEDAKVVNALNTYLDGLDSDDRIYIIAATNRVELLDPSITRPGRFDRIIPVGNPTIDEIVEIYQIHTKRIQKEAIIQAFNTIDYQKIADESKGFSGAEIAEMIRRSRDSKKWLEYETGKDAQPINTEDILAEIEKYDRTRAGSKPKKEALGFTCAIKKTK